MNCPEPPALFEYHLGELPRAHSEALDVHLAECASCRRAVQELEELGPAIAPAPGEFEDDSFVTDVLTQSRATPVRPRRPLLRPWHGITALAAALVMVLGVAISMTLTEQEPAGFQARSATVEPLDAWVALRPFQQADGSFQPLGNTMQPTDRLAFAYINGAAASFDYLMVLAVDSSGELHWLYPPTHDGGPARSITIETTDHGRELSDVIAGNFPPGPLRLVALFSKEPLYTDRVASVVQRQLAAGTLERVAIADTGQHLIEITVEALPE